MKLEVLIIQNNIIIAILNKCKILEMTEISKNSKKIRNNFLKLFQLNLLHNKHYLIIKINNNNKSNNNCLNIIIITITF